MDGNQIECVEKYETENKKKPVFDKVMKILGLTKEELDENGDR